MRYIPYKKDLILTFVFNCIDKAFGSQNAPKV